MVLSTMTAELGEEKMLDSSQFLAEQKFDGTRGKLIKRDGKIYLINKELVDYTARLPEVTLDAERIPASDYVIDGELCVFDSNGHTVFKGSQIRCSTEDLAKQKLLRAKYPIVFMCQCSCIICFKFDRDTLEI